MQMTNFIAPLILQMKLTQFLGMLSHTYPHPPEMTK